MASTYSTNLKIELIGTGEQSGTWGTTTNTNLGSLIEEAIAGYVTQAVTDGAATVLTIPNGASSNGRNYVIQLTGALTANRTVEVPAVDKPYIFFNATTGGFSVTVKVSGQTGVTIANGKKAIVYTNSTDVIEVANAPVTEAGTQTLTNKTLTNPTINGFTGDTSVVNIGSGQFYKDTSGNVGIGTASPSYKLDVSRASSGVVAKFTGTASAYIYGGAADVYFTSDTSANNAYGANSTSNYLNFYTNGSERARIDSSGNVGIGTSSPNYQLQLYKTGASANYLQVTSGATGAASGNGTLFGVDASGNGIVTVQGAVNYITSVAGAERMRIDSSGNVGIGTSSPGFKLEVVGGTNNGIHIKDAASATVYGGLFTQASNMALITRSNHALTFGTNDAERMRIDTSGNLGVGTTSPTAKITAYSGGTNATTYNTMIAAGGGSTATIQNQGTTSVSTTATTILTSGQYGSFCLVFGSDGTNRFMDVVLFGLGTGTVNVISSLGVAGSPSARTYSQSSSTYKLAMASGTYTVQVAAFSMSG